MNKRSISRFLLLPMVTVSLAGGVTTRTEATAYNYGEALQKSIMFYELQRSGKLPEDKRDNWRGDSALTDGSDVGLDLTGGWYDAGDHVKFNLPGAYTSTMLAWSVYEDKETYEQNGQLKYIMDAIKWENDYLMKCHPEPNVYYFQVGDAVPDHNWWGPAEAMTMTRTSHKADMSKPATTATAEAAASLAAAATIFKDSDPTYAATCLKHAKELFSFADNTKSDSGYTSDGCYNLDGKFYDELSWAATWLYLASGESSYLNKAEGYVPNWCYGAIPYNWSQDWNNVYNGTELLLAKITNKSLYKENIEKHLDYWSTGYNGERVHYVGDLACISGWGSLRYAAATSFLAGVYADWSGADASKAANYRGFMQKQINYILGSSGQSFVVGFGDKYPQFPHHRTAHGSWNNDNVNPTPAKERHILYGALVGGPDYNGEYKDELLEYTRNEVACDYNAGLVGALSKMYKLYGGDPIANFNAIEQKGDEYYVESTINSNGSNGINVKAVLNNISGWPAKISDKLSFKYFVDLSEYIQAGGNPDSISVSTSYAQAGSMSSKLKVWNKDKNIYYAEADFSGTKIGPGSTDSYKKEINFTINAPYGSQWNNSNDFSYSSTSGMNNKIAVYDDGVLVGGSEAEKESGTIVDIVTLLGDVNEDGKVTIKDYIKLQKYLLNSSTEISKANADLNKDGKINVTDALLLKKQLLG